MLFPPVEDSLIQGTTISLDQIKIQNVGRIDSNLFNLDDYQIPPKVSEWTLSSSIDSRS